MHIEAPDVAVDGRARVKLAIVEALVQRVLKLTHLKLQLESNLSNRFLASLDTSVVFIRIILKGLWHEIELLIFALNLRQVNLKGLFRVIFDLIEYALAIGLVATLVALLVPLVLQVQTLHHLYHICLKLGLEGRNQENFVLVTVVQRFLWGLM